jgi:hypothetical protein
MLAGHGPEVGEAARSGRSGQGRRILGGERPYTPPVFLSRSGLFVVLVGVIAGCGGSKTATVTVSARSSLSPRQQARSVLALANDYWASTEGLAYRAEAAVSDDAHARCPALLAAAKAKKSRRDALDLLLFTVEGMKGQQIAYPPYRRYVGRFAKLHPTAPALKRLLTAKTDELNLVRRVLAVHIDVCTSMRDLAAQHWRQKPAKAIGAALYHSFGFDQSAIRDAQGRASDDHAALQRLGLSFGDAIRITSVSIG